MRMSAPPVRCSSTDPHETHQAAYGRNWRNDGGAPLETGSFWCPGLTEEHAASLGFVKAKIALMAAGFNVEEI